MSLLRNSRFLYKGKSSDTSTVCLQKCVILKDTEQKGREAFINSFSKYSQSPEAALLPKYIYTKLINGEYIGYDKLSKAYNS